MATLFCILSPWFVNYQLNWLVSLDFQPRVGAVSLLGALLDDRIMLCDATIKPRFRPCPIAVRQPGVLRESTLIRCATSPAQNKDASDGHRPWTGDASILVVTVGQKVETPPPVAGEEGSQEVGAGGTESGALGDVAGILALTLGNGAPEKWIRTLHTWVTFLGKPPCRMPVK